VTEPAHVPRQFVILEKNVANETVRLNARQGQRGAVTAESRRR
jgi:hypothetical protein